MKKAIKEKRFQESSIIVKLWRLRWYLAVPFIWLYYQLFKRFKVGETEIINEKVVHTDKFGVIKGIEL